MEEEYDTQIEEALENQPEEVVDAFADNISEDILNKISEINPIPVKDILFHFNNYLLEIETEQEFFSFVDSVVPSEEVKSLIKASLYQKVLEPLTEKLVENNSPDNTQVDVPIEIKTSPSDGSFLDTTPLEIPAPVEDTTIPVPVPTPVFSLASKMTMPGVVAPIASVGQKFVPGAQIPVAPSAPRPATDPYREMPL